MNVIGAVVIRGRRLFEVQRLLEGILYPYLIRLIESNFSKIFLRLSQTRFSTSEKGQRLTSLEQSIKIRNENHVLQIYFKKKTKVKFAFF